MKTEKRNIILIIAGTFISSVGINVFYIPNELVSGGLAGLGIIIMFYLKKFFGFLLPVSLVTLTFNIPLFITACNIFGKKYIKRSVLAALLFSLFLQLTNYFPDFYGNIMLSSVYGGIFLGTGTGLVLKGSATTGGTETAAYILNYKHSSISVSNFILILDSLIILAGLFAFGAEKCMFSIVSVFVASRCIKTIYYGSSSQKAIVIFSDKSAQIVNYLKTNSLNEINRQKRGRMISLLEGNYPNSALCIFSQRDMTQVMETIRRVDSSAFFIVFDIKEVSE